MLDPSDGPLLSVFASVVRHGSFTEAARQLRLSKSIVSERIQQLETRCGVRLIERTTRRLTLTESGRELFDATKEMEATLVRIGTLLDSNQKEPSGLLRVATTHDLGPNLVAPVVAQLVNMYPKVRVEISVDDRSLDIIEAKLDVAVRLGAPKESGFVVKSLATLREPIVAAPQMAAHWLSSRSPLALQGAPWVRHSLLRSGPMKFYGPKGSVEEFSPNVVLETNSGATLLSLILNGGAIGVLPEHVLTEHLAMARLIELCPGWYWKEISLYALMPSAPSRRVVVKTFLTMLADKVQQDRVRFGGSSRRLNYFLHDALSPS